MALFTLHKHAAMPRKGQFTTNAEAFNKENKTRDKFNLLYVSLDSLFCSVACNSKYDDVAASKYPDASETGGVMDNTLLIEPANTDTSFRFFQQSSAIATYKMDAVRKEATCLCLIILEA
eukprot:CAMPEP_0116066780 /NCGR_PEP_ID=MMETSP0322-20121206/10600_1 /TAXON_ID=163516 /ORGANISM="Leptocylindrus danicus var. apora, Strain B651" /LENGTH=119 /DNA_ID=CAMNT_0003553427 /DNA_START=732 /DNA_END=1091 /DNA_ORIENTATION=-